MPNRILVTGATGKAGRSLVRSLLAKGYDVRAAARNINQIPSSASVEAVPFDYSDENTFKHALEGATGVFVVAPPMDPDVERKLGPFIKRAQAMGVPHLILLSALGVDQNESAPLRCVEHMVIDSGIPSTILRPNFFMENFSSGSLASMIKNQDRIFLAAGNGKTSFVSTQDIAAVATISFSEGGSGKEYVLTGPEALDHAEVARLISEATGRVITYVDLPEEAMLQGARQQGLPESSVQYLRVLYAAVRAGQCEVITDDVRRVTGRNALSFRGFLEARKDAWQLRQ